MKLDEDSEKDMKRWVLPSEYLSGFDDEIHDFLFGVVYCLVKKNDSNFDLPIFWQQKIINKEMSFSRDEIMSAIDNTQGVMLIKKDYNVSFADLFSMVCFNNNLINRKVLEIKYVLVNKTFDSWAFGILVSYEVDFLKNIDIFFDQKIVVFLSRPIVKESEQKSDKKVFYNIVFVKGKLSQNMFDQDILYIENFINKLKIKFN